MGNHGAVFLLREFQTNSKLSEILLTDLASRCHSLKVGSWIMREKCWLFSLVISEIAGFSIPPFNAHFGHLTPIRSYS
jgi:hypothetical protein